MSISRPELDTRPRADIKHKKELLWARFDIAARARVERSYQFELSCDMFVAPFSAMQGASERILYTLFMACGAHTVSEIRYLMLARWWANSDSNTVRARLSQMLLRGLVRQSSERYLITESGKETVLTLSNDWQARQLKHTRRTHQPVNMKTRRSSK